MKRYMLDTNTVSHLLKANPAVTRRIVAAPMTSLCISAITEGELLYGLAKRPDAKRLHAAVREFLRRMDVLPWDSTVAEHYGTMRADIERQGKALATLDLLIATHALAADSVLVSSDLAFRQIAGLRLENWAE
jgi:tRNA(fMet)-specific endonuclease VapC